MSTNKKTTKISIIFLLYFNPRKGCKDKGPEGEFIPSPNRIERKPVSPGNKTIAA